MLSPLIDRPSILRASNQPIMSPGFEFIIILLTTPKQENLILPPFMRSHTVKNEFITSSKDINTNNFNQNLNQGCQLA